MLLRLQPGPLVSTGCISQAGCSMERVLCLLFTAVPIAHSVLIDTGWRCHGGASEWWGAVIERGGHRYSPGSTREKRGGRAACEQWSCFEADGCSEAQMCRQWKDTGLELHNFLPSVSTSILFVCSFMLLRSLCSLLFGLCSVPCFTHSFILPSIPSFFQLYPFSLCFSDGQ